MLWNVLMIVSGGALIAGVIFGKSGFPKNN